MAEIHWLSPVKGNFNAAPDWSGGAVPGAGDDAYLDASGHRFVVTVTATAAVNGIDLAANSTLAIGAHQSFTAASGSDGGANAGLISVGDGARFGFGGTMDNRGTIALTGTGFGTSLDIYGATTLSGGGTVSLGDSTGADYHGIGGIGVLTNLDNTVTGAGYIFTDGSALINAAGGVIDADGAHILTIFEAGTLTNAGLIEATGSGGLTLAFETVLNTGTIAGTGSGALTLDGATIVNSGGGVLSPGANLVLQRGSTVLTHTMTVAVGQTITAAGDFSTSFLSADTLTNAGQIVIESEANLMVRDAVVNVGVILFSGPGIGTLGAYGDVTLSGGGEIDFGAGGLFTTASGGSGSLFNLDNTIVGSGDISGLLFGNRPLGVIDADGADRLTIDSCELMSNAGLFEATNGGELRLQDEAISGAGGTILVGAGSRLDLFRLRLHGGVLGIAAGGSLVVDTGRSTVARAAVTNAGLIEAASGGIGRIRGAIDNDGIIAVVGGGRLNVTGAVSGSGSASIDHGRLIFQSKFTQNVIFIGTLDTLTLGRSQAYTGEVSGFSSTGGTTFDLGDIGFVSSSEATFSGTATSGVLTVTDGTHTARISLEGDYLSADFVAGDDGQGGTSVVATSGAVSAPPHRLIAAMAGLDRGTAGPVALGHAPPPREQALARPHAMTA